MIMGSDAALWEGESSSTKGRSSVLTSHGARPVLPTTCKAVVYKGPHTGTTLTLTHRVAIKALSGVNAAADRTARKDLRLHLVLAHHAPMLSNHQPASSAGCAVYLSTTPHQRTSCISCTLLETKHPRYLQPPPPALDSSGCCCKEGAWQVV